MFFQIITKQVPIYAAYIYASNCPIVNAKPITLGKATLFVKYSFNNMAIQGGSSFEEHERINKQLFTKSLQAIITCGSYIGHEHLLEHKIHLHVYWCISVESPTAMDYILEEAYKKNSFPFLV